jgi:glycosyltransferase involved in cell wall biosynthesis
MRWLHRDSRAVLVTTESMRRELDAWSLHPNLIVWSRGVDLDLFNPDLRWADALDPPTLVYVGRTSIEKNIEAFLSLPEGLGNKIVVGDGPDRERLERQFPDAWFVGYKHGEELASMYANASVFVFPSKTDTFGIVMIEANACGTPVAAYPVTGPLDFVKNGLNGTLDDDLESAVKQALALDREAIRTYVEENYAWSRSAEIFEDVLIPITNRWDSL